jgi:hypothetical protein
MRVARQLLDSVLAARLAGLRLPELPEQSAGWPFGALNALPLV